MQTSLEEWTKSHVLIQNQLDTEVKVEITVEKRQLIITAVEKPVNSGTYLEEWTRRHISLQNNMKNNTHLYEFTVDKGQLVINVIPKKIDVVRINPPCSPIEWLQKYR